VIPLISPAAETTGAIEVITPVRYQPCGHPRGRPTASSYLALMETVMMLVMSSR
jgi:hypothetical protein